ncbi:alpha/beta hydrolase [Anaerorhabdus sp.]|jgi:esterase/lipase|uniref:alpha/beta hydrolase n=1 Tax=Anaerorhabdus sp. TaxID=1872524 RepID=UPI002FC901D3
MKLFNSRKNKPVIVCFHGFGRRRSDEFIPLVKAFKDYEVITPNFYDLTDETDNDWTHWINRAESVLTDLASDGRRIIIIGFSMGGVIASYLANKPNVEKLILLAPAFEYINIGNATDLVTSIFDKKEKEESPYPEIPSSFTIAFVNLVNNCKIAVEDIHVPTCIFHGLEDDVIQYSSSRKFYKKIPATEKHLFLIEDVHHRILDDSHHAKYTIECIKQFINDEK